MGRRRRRVVKVLKRTLPKVYGCPRCGMFSIRVAVKEGHANLGCGNCGLTHDILLEKSREPIDIYNQFVDQFMTGKVSV